MTFQVTFKNFRTVKLVPVSRTVVFPCGLEGHQTAFRLIQYWSVGAVPDVGNAPVHLYETLVEVYRGRELLDVHGYPLLGNDTIRDVIGNENPFFREQPGEVAYQYRLYVLGTNHR